jgi:hypothetical protein
VVVVGVGVERTDPERGKEKVAVVGNGEEIKVGAVPFRGVAAFLL